jgi:CheY-like chemotaxis protein
MLRSHADEAVRGIPVVILTGELEPSLLEQAIETGADRYINKPVSVKQLKVVIDKTLYDDPAA